jgi:hypothetical protein
VQRLPVERIAESDGRDSRRVARQGQERDEVTGTALELEPAPSPNRPRGRGTAAEPKLRAVPPLSEQQQVCQLMIEALPAEPAEDHDLGRTHLHGTGYR